MLKELAFQKGWAGKTISRADTVDRLNPIIREHMIVNRSYDAVINSIGDQETSSALGALQKTARMNASKLAETIYSCGGVAFNGTDLNPKRFDLGSGAAAIEKLQSLDTELLTLLKAEGEVEHQMRTRAIIAVVMESTEARLSELRTQLMRIR